MTLVWLAFALAVIVAGFTFLIWDVGWQARKQQRVLEVSHGRRVRQVEDRAWQTSRHAEYQHAMTITLTRANVAAFDDLVDALTRPPRPRMDVVA